MDELVTSKSTGIKMRTVVTENLLQVSHILISVIYAIDNLRVLTLSP